MKRTCSLALPLLLLLPTVLRAQNPSLTASVGTAGQIQLTWPATTTGFALEQTVRLGSGAAWSAVNATIVVSNGRNVVQIAATDAARYFRLRASAEASLVTVLTTSPANGERGVSVNREVILDLSGPLGEGSLPTTTTLTAEASGRRLLSRADLAADRRRLVLFLLEPVPAAARVKVKFQGDTLRDVQGRAIDADGDGRPGGTASIEYDTVNTSALQGTAVTGHVYASDPEPTGAGVTNRPLAGVWITVDGAEERLRTATDENGFFRLHPCPTGRFFVHIDGRQALGSQWPNGDYYPFVGKPFEAVAGTTNNLAGGTGQIFLPLIKAGTLQPIQPNQPTVVTLPTEVTAKNPGLAGVSITVPPNALYADDGLRGGRVGLAPVAPDRIPSPLPEGLNLPLVITVQTDGPANFDQPVPARFPNLPDPKTGLKLPPGAKSALWSFNHDTGRWEIQGSMTVTADGNYVETDPGVGIRQPGWHGASPGGTGAGGGGHNGPCDAEQQALEDALLGCAIGGALELADLAWPIGCGISLGSAAASTFNACSDPNNNCYASAAYNGFFGVAGCVPGVGTFTGLLQCSIEVGDAVGNLAACQSLHPSSLQSANSSLRRLAAKPANNDTAQLQEQLLDSAEELVLALLGDPLWMSASSLDASNMVTFATAFIAALEPASPEAARISAAERSALLALPAPAGLGMDVRNALIDRFDRFAAGGMTAAEQSAVQNAGDNLAAVSARAQAQGWTTMIDGIKETWSEVVTQFDAAADGVGGPARLALQGASTSAPPGGNGSSVGPIHEREMLYRVIDQSTGFTRRGRTDARGLFDQLMVAADTEHILTLLDPVTLEVGSIFFKSGGPGLRFEIPRIRLTRVTGPDTDQDGLTDLMEGIVGTLPNAADTDNDGTPDLVEVQQGQNPLDGLALPQGVVANLLLGGSAANARALGLHLEGTQVFVANGRRGLAIVDLTNPLQPAWVSELDLPGESFDVTYSPERRVVGLIATPDAYLPGERGLLQFVDVADPVLPRLMQSYSIPVTAIDAYQGVFYVALGQFAFKEVRLYDAGTALEIGSLVTQDYPTGVRVTGGRAYVATTSGLEIFDLTLPQLTRLGRLAGDFSTELLGRAQMVVEGTTLYVSKANGPVTIDVSNPASPKFIGRAPANSPASRALALNGGRRMAALTLQTPSGNTQAASSLSVYDVSDPSNLGRFQLSLPTLWRGRDLVLLNGFAIVADDLAGLTVLNFAQPDLNRIAPSVTLDLSRLDEDPARTGVQVSAGRTVFISPQVQDDVHLDRVELLVGGALTATERTYPATFKLVVPSLDLTRFNTNLIVQFRAFDRSGNVGLGQPLTLEIVPDTTPPVLQTSLPGRDGAAFVGQPFTFHFSEPIDAAPIDLTKIRLVYLGSDNTSGGGDDTEVALPTASVSEASLSLLYSSQLSPGRYRLSLQTGALKDRSGNPLAEAQEIAFSLYEAHPSTSVWLSDADGQFDDPTRWLYRRVPGQDNDVILQRFGAKPRVTLGSSVTVKSLFVGTPFTVVNRGGLTVFRDFNATDRIEVSTGTLLLNGNARFDQPLVIAGGQVEASARLETRDLLNLSQGGSLTLDGPEAALTIGAALEAVNCTFAVKNGAVVALPNLESFESPGDFTALFPAGAAFRSQGFGSRFTLPNLASANGPVNWNVRGAPAIRFEAVSGGQLSLPKLTTLTGRTVLVADGFDSVLDAPALTRVTGPTSDFESAIGVTGSARLQVPRLALVEHADITLDSDGVLSGENLEIAATSSLKGVGIVSANVLNRGVIGLDRVPGSLVFERRLELAPSSVINTTLGLGGARTEAGRLETRGETALAGTVQLTLARFYTPQANQQFEIATFTQPPSGAVAAVDDTALGKTLKAELTATPTTWNVKLLTRP